MKRYYVYRMGEAGDTFDADYEPDTLGRWVKYEDAANAQRQLAEVTRERDAALAALGELQATATHMLDAADALLKERDNYRAVCVLADALRNKERGL